MEYCGLLNWTVDVPRGTRLIFENILEMFRSKEEPKILEVGSFAGTSIMTIKNILPHSVCYSIDNWTLVQDEFDDCKKYMQNKNIKVLSDVRDYFFRNTDGKVILYEMDSALALQTLIKEHKTFDFIYVDGSHTTNDTITDIVLSWSILNKGGVLGVDDYLYVKNDSNDRPGIAVDYFMEKFKGQYIVLDKGYRVFFMKIN
jgi:hypothetical protein